MSEATRVLQRLSKGDRHAAAELLPLVYEELRGLAAGRMRNERPSHTLQPTALVHEAYLRLVASNSESVGWEDRGHFFAAAGKAMRQVLLDHARTKQRLKRGGKRQRVDLAVLLEVTEDERLQTPEYVEALNDAMERLIEQDPLAAELVNLRFFSGLTIRETADTMGISPRSADRIWQYARAWLYTKVFDDSTS